MVVIGVDGVSCNKGEVVGREVELPRYDIFSQLLRGSEIAVKRPVVEFITEGQLDAFDPSFLVVEWGEEDWRTELPFVEQVAGDLVIGIDPGFEPGQNHLSGADIKVMGSFRLGPRIESDRRRGGAVSNKSEVRRRDKLERRRCEIARIAKLECRRLGRLPYQIDPRAELPFADKLGKLVVTRAEILG